MHRRFFRHKDDPSRKQEIFRDPTGAVTVVQVRGQRREVKQVMKTLEGAIKDAALFGYLEVTEDGQLVTQRLEDVDLTALTKRVASDPYRVFAEARELLGRAAKPLLVLRLLLQALDGNERDTDEHDTANYNSYFPPTDEDEPTYDALFALRGHWRAVVARLEKGEQVPTSELDLPS